MKHCTKIKVSDITSPLGKGVVRILENHWWVVTPDDEVLLYGGYSPQCNRNKAIAERMLRIYTGCTVKQLPLAFVPFDPS